MPTTINFGKLFGKSPFKPMKKHMHIATECARNIPPALEAMLKGDKGSVKEYKHIVFDLEEDADKILEELQSRLPKTMFMPVDRRDLLDVLEMQEAIADRAQDIVGLMSDLPLDIPEDMHKPMLRLSRRCVDACEGAYQVVKSFDELVETGFKGPDVTRVQSLIHEVVATETDADTLGIEITHTLFGHRAELDPVSVMFIYQLVNWIDDLADFAEKLVIRARLFLAR